ncbi:MAG: VacJ family lipoprotein [Motiliproteus sp.]
MTKHLSNLISIAALSLLMTGCGTTSNIKEIAPTPKVSAIVSTDLHYPIDVYDPWEGFNRRMYNFNTKFDRYIFIPVVNAYEAVLPDPVEDSISNFFSNLGEIGNFANSLLQLKGKAMASAASRFAINTTVGILGFFDPATYFGINELDEDFGQTLSYWGAGSGPYLVLPVFGPSSVRDTAGLAVDAWLDNEVDLLNYDDHTNREAVVVTVKAIDARHNVSFRYLQGSTPFEYEKIRYLYTKKRELDALK